MVELGDKAPHFTLYDSDEEMRSLSDFSGKPLIILFFPLAFSSVCTEEMNKMQGMISDINSLDAQVIGISVDSIYTLAEFKKKYGYEFPLLSDYNKDVSRSYGALCAEYAYGMKGVTKRASFVADSKLKIAYKEILENPDNLPNFENIQATLKKLKK